jgi:hypothetical protein
MPICARSDNSIVVELFALPDGFALADCFLADIAAQFVPAPHRATVQQGWSWHGTVFAAPPPPPKPRVLTSTSQPSHAGRAGRARATSRDSGAMSGRSESAPARRSFARTNAFRFGKDLLPPEEGVAPWAEFDAGMDRLCAIMNEGEEPAPGN